MTLRYLTLQHSKFLQQRHGNSPKNQFRLTSFLHRCVSWHFSTQPQNSGLPNPWIGLEWIPLQKMSKLHPQKNPNHIILHSKLTPKTRRHSKKSWLVRLKRQTADLNLTHRPWTHVNPRNDPNPLLAAPSLITCRNHSFPVLRHKKKVFSFWQLSLFNLRREGNPIMNSEMRSQWICRSLLLHLMTSSDFFWCGLIGKWRVHRAIIAVAGSSFAQI